MLPNLSHLSTMPVSAPKRKLTDEIYFKAYRRGSFRKLSNLFGPVEWKYQQAKFKEGSVVYDFLKRGLEKTLAGSFTYAEFTTTLQMMGHEGKPESYADDDRALATGLIAQMTSVIAKNPTSSLARKRLKYIMNRTQPLSEVEALAWHNDHVHSALDDNRAKTLMLSLLREKYALPQYKQLLLQTDTQILHEGKGRGPPNKWEWQETPLSPDREAKGFTRGGDVLGQLLMQVRAEIFQND